MSARTITAPSYAKLNVYLEVLARRPDGYHELETVMLKAQLSDQLEFAATASGVINLEVIDLTEGHTGAQVPTDDRNLVVQIARALQQRTGCRLGCDIRLEKRIPPQSGLGGGSSNAATTIRSLNQLWNLQLPDTILHEVAAAHGSDINFLLSDERAALCRGRGERVEPIEIPRSQFFVATRPVTGNSTADVFRRVQLPDSPESPERTLAWLRSDKPTEPYCFNRLTQAASDLNQDMARMIESLRQATGRHVQMSGSGSTVFVSAKDANDAEQLAEAVQIVAGRQVWKLEC